MNKLIEYFKPLSAQQILNLPLGKWNDNNLLDVANYFDKNKDRERQAAVNTLILRSPELSELIAYGELYLDMLNYGRWTEDYDNALAWVYAAIAYDEQHWSGQNRENGYQELTEIYLLAQDFDTALSIITRCLQMMPHDIWAYNILGLTLPHVDLNDLCVEVLERALKLVAEEDEEDLKEQLTNLYEKALEKTKHTPSRIQEINPTVLANLRAAMQQEEDHPDGMSAYLPPLDQLIDARDTIDEALHNKILDQGKVLAADLIKMAFDKNLQNTPASHHAIKLLRQLHAKGTVPLTELNRWLTQAEGDWQTELLTEHTGKIGGFTTDELKTIAADTNLALYVRTNASNALVERVEKCPTQREDIIEFMRMILTRPEAFESAEEETMIGFVIGDALDINATELYSEIEAAYKEDRVDASIVGFDSVQEELGIGEPEIIERRKDGLYLLLECTQCNRQREHFVQHVTVDTNSLAKIKNNQSLKYSPYIMDREIICPKCGSCDQYELTPQASIRLMMPDDNSEGLEYLESLLGDKKPLLNPNPRVKFHPTSVFGRLMHPLVGLDKYKKLMAKQPNNAQLRVNTATLLRTLHRYPQSLEYYHKAYQLDKNNVEVIINLAMAEHDFGNPASAKTLYQKAISLATVKSLSKPHLLDIVDVAEEGLILLERGKSSSWQIKTPTSLNKGESTKKYLGSKKRKKIKSKPKRKKGKRKK